MGRKTKLQAVLEESQAVFGEAKLIEADQLKAFLENKHANFVSIYSSSDYSLYYWKGLQKCELRVRDYLMPGFKESGKLDEMRALAETINKELKSYHNRLKRKAEKVNA